ncbi:MAG TPA: diacylglycerol kinase family protein [Microbacteriaceae bacterium]|nr:diacylglycerol kinase family protein [Microbacteriaceae bacterium]
MADSSDRALDGSRAAVVYNPTSISVPALRAAVAEQERRAGWAPSSWHETAADDSGRAAAREAVSDNPDMVIVAGGDGTVRVVAENIRESGVRLGVVPAGTGNLLARNLDIPVNDLKNAVRIAFSGVDRIIDVARIELEDADGTRHAHDFLVMAGIGLDAHMAANTNERLKKRIGWLAYTDPIARSVIGNEQLSMQYQLDGSRPRTLRAHTVIAGNCGTLTANILLLPDAVIDDGLLDIVALRPSNRFAWARIVSSLVLNRFTHRTKPGRLARRAAGEFGGLQYAQAHSLVVRLAEPQQIQLDGDSFGVVSALKISIVDAALPVRVERSSST